MKAGRRQGTPFAQRPLELDRQHQLLNVTRHLNRKKCCSERSARQCFTP
uniref:Uncharacterized protein n=1 Tax=Tetraselmis sp. GSL018 TaxID=582737 RepID=A0A061S7M3_9CHLO